MNPAMKRFVNRYQPIYDTIARLDISQLVRDEVAAKLTDALEGQPDFKPDTFRLLASDPLCMCAGTDDGPCPDEREIRIGMHLSTAEDGRSAAWELWKPTVRCLSCGTKMFVESAR